MVSTTQRELSDRCGVPVPTHTAATERLTVTRPKRPSSSEISYDTKPIAEICVLENSARCQYLLWAQLCIAPINDSMISHYVYRCTTINYVAQIIRVNLSLLILFLF